jgi:hypothetical protein
MFKKLVLLFFFVCVWNNVVGQISINFPMERQIFQRNNSNEAFIHISGNFISEYDSITAKVFPRFIGQGTESNWQIVDYRDGKPYFSGKIIAKGGWYELAVKAYKNGVQIDSVGRKRVGVGEIFVIAGQSNATGTTDVSGLGIDTNEDRCNVMGYSNQRNNNNTLPFGFTPMNADSVASDTVIVGPFQIAPWIWGKVSEDLVSALNVPVLFYGAGYGGTLVAWWYQSAYHLPYDPVPGGAWVRSDYQHPYGALGNVMKFYASLTGIRAVLWHQGEAEDQYSTANDYQSSIDSVIAKTRDQVESTSLAWIVARASYANGSKPNTILGQNQAINNDVNVFAGPETDNLTGSTYRSDNTHLDTGTGMMEHANYWVNYLTNGFLSNSTPVLAEDFIEVDFSCNLANPTTPINLSSVGGYAKYAWSNRDNSNIEAIGYTSDGKGAYTLLPPLSYNRLNWQYDSTSSITVGPGKYALNVRKPTSGKVLFSPIVDLNTFTLPTNPTFLSSASQIRSGDTLTLTGSNCNGIYKWSTSSTSNPYKLYPTGTDNYTVACKTLHCLSTASAPTNVIVSSCFPNALYLAGNVMNLQSPYQSQQTISSIQKFSPTGQLEYMASKTITLNPGFQVDSGSTFKAIIGNCP